MRLRHLAALAALAAAAVLIAPIYAASVAAVVTDAPTCLGEFELCPSSGSCVLQSSQCSVCSLNEYLCPDGVTCVPDAAGYFQCPGLKGTHLDWTLPVEARIDYLLGVLTIEEKSQQLQNDAPAIPAQGIPSYNWLNDDVHAVMQAEATVFPDGCGLGATWNKELLRDVGYLIGMEARATHNAAVHRGDRGHLENGVGITTYAPNINLVRDPRWGRNQEVYGEDPFLTGKLAAAYVQGQQGANETETPYMLAGSCCKHYVAYDVDSLPTSRVFFDSVVQTRDFWESYLPMFDACVNDGGATSVMCSYNSMNGVPTCADPNLLNGILRDRWSWTGFVVSDYDAWADLVTTHKICEDFTCAAAAGINAGMDQEGGGSIAIDSMPDAVAAGLVEVATVDAALRRLLRVRIGLGMLDPPTLVQPFNDISNATLESAAHLAWARVAAQQSMTLLKNDNGTLPLLLAKPTSKSIALIGPQWADADLLTGNYAREPNAPGMVSLIDGLLTTLQIDLGAASCQPPQTGIDYRYEALQPGYRTWTVEQCANLCAAQVNGARCEFYTWLDFWCFLSPNGRNVTKTAGALAASCSLSPPPAFEPVTHAFGCADVECANDNLFAPAIASIAGADTILITLGLDGLQEGETRDRSVIELPGMQYALLSAVSQAASESQSVVCVLVHGGTFALQNLLTDCDAILDAWYPGQQGGLAVSDALFGLINPGGKTAATWYRSTSDLPALGEQSFYPNATGAAGKLGVTYRFFQGAVDVPFGFGLSYTQFQYSSIQAPTTAGPCDEITVSVAVTNVGGRAGDAVVQAYVKQLNPSVSAPQLRLVGFERVSNLLPGAQATVMMTVDPAYRSVVAEEGMDAFWKPTRLVQQGDIEVFLGGSQPGFGQQTLSATIGITGTSTLDECDANKKQ